MTEQYFAMIVGQILVIWMVITGMAFVVRGPRGAGALNKWLLRAIARGTRSILGGIFISLGTTIRGKKKKSH